MFIFTPKKVTDGVNNSEMITIVLHCDMTGMVTPTTCDGLHQSEH